jgi:hypothetical protein
VKMKKLELIDKTVDGKRVFSMKLDGKEVEPHDMMSYKVHRNGEEKYATLELNIIHRVEIEKLDVDVKEDDSNGKSKE